MSISGDEFEKFVAEESSMYVCKFGTKGILLLSALSLFINVERL